MIQQHPNGVVITVRVTPRASRDSIEGEMRLPGEIRSGAEAGTGEESTRKISGGAGEESVLKVRLTAPPVDDRANDALRKLLARSLKVPVSAVKILSGEKSRTKRVLIEGVTVAQAREFLAGRENRHIRG